MKLPRFEYLSPKSLQEACCLLSTYGSQARILAGGTDLLVDLKKRVSSQEFPVRGRKGIVPQYIIGLKGISGLARIEYFPGEGLRLGPLTTHAEVANSSIIKEKYPLLRQACHIFSRPQIRYAGTLVGNLCNDSPSADIIPPLIALGAKARLVNAEAEREIAVEEFCVGPFKTVLREDELVAELMIPETPRPYGWSYQRKTKITVEDEALVLVAVLLQFADRDQTIRQGKIALGSVTPRPSRALNAEAMMKGKRLDNDLVRQVSEVASTEIQPRSRADYRRLMTSYLVRKALTEACSL